MAKNKSKKLGHSTYAYVRNVDVQQDANSLTLPVVVYVEAGWKQYFIQINESWYEFSDFPFEAEGIVILSIRQNELVESSVAIDTLFSLASQNFLDGEEGGKLKQALNDKLQRLSGESLHSFDMRDVPEIYSEIGLNNAELQWLKGIGKIDSLDATNLFKKIQKAGIQVKLPKQLQPAYLKFNDECLAPGMHVIQAHSNSGKSFVLATIGSVMEQCAGEVFEAFQIFEPSAHVDLPFEDLSEFSGWARMHRGCFLVIDSLSAFLIILHREFKKGSFLTGGESSILVPIFAALNAILEENMICCFATLNPFDPKEEKIYNLTGGVTASMLLRKSDTYLVGNEELYNSLVTASWRFPFSKKGGLILEKRNNGNDLVGDEQSDPSDDHGSFEYRRWL